MLCMGVFKVSKKEVDEFKADKDDGHVNYDSQLRSAILLNLFLAGGLRPPARKQIQLLSICPSGAEDYNSSDQLICVKVGNALANKFQNPLETGPETLSATLEALESNNVDVSDVLTQHKAPQLLAHWLTLPTK